MPEIGEGDWHILGPFSFIDRIAEVKKNESLTAFYTLQGSEEFLKDHFENFPVMPGVLLLETLIQAASELLILSEGRRGDFFRLVSAEEVKFGQFIRPESELKIFVRLLKKEGHFRSFEGRIDWAQGLENRIFRKALTAHVTLGPVGK